MKKQINDCSGDPVSIIAFTQAEIDSALSNEAVWIAETSTRKASSERSWRDLELTDTDKTQLADTDLTTAKVAEFKQYRRELKDMPTLTGFPDTHTRPVRPL